MTESPMLWVGGYADIDKFVVLIQPIHPMMVGCDVFALICASCFIFFHSTNLYSSLVVAHLSIRECRCVLPGYPPRWDIPPSLLGWGKRKPPGHYYGGLSVCCY